MKRALFVALVLASCGDSRREAPQPAAPIAPAPAHETPAVDPLEGLDREIDPDEIVPPLPTAPPSEATVAGAVPPHGCVALYDAATRVWPRPGPASIVATGDAFVVAGYAREPEGRETLFAVRASPSALPMPLVSPAIDPPLRAARPHPPSVVALSPHEAALTWIDGRGEVRMARLSAQTPTPHLAPVWVGAGADPRFPPVIASAGDAIAVAYTDGSATPMRTRLAMVSGDDVGTPADVTPNGLGGAAPVFARGATRPTLYFVDARAGVSPLVRVVVGEEGAAGPGEMARPLGSLTEPPEIAVVDVPFGRLVAYTAVGNAATTAVGLVRLDVDGAAPVALVPGTGYGVLHLDGVAGPHAAVFVADAPLAAPPASPREAHLRVVSEEGPGPALVIRGPEGHATNAAVARAESGTVAVTFTTPSGVFVSFARCDD